MRFHFLIMAFVLNVIPACKTASPASVKTAGKGKQYLALGDSYTIGESVRPQETYPQLLVDAFNQKETVFDAPVIIARTGWTTADLQRGIREAGISGRKYDLVSLLIGVNNEFQGRSMAEFEKEFAQLLEQAIAFAPEKEHVLVLSIPDYGFTPFGKDRQPKISARIDQFNAVVKKVAEEKGVRYFDITPISRKGLSEKSLVAGDGLHPSGKMYQQFVDLITESVHY